MNNWPLFGLLPSATQMVSNSTQMLPNAAQMFPNATQMLPNAVQMFPNATQMFPYAPPMFQFPSYGPSNQAQVSNGLQSQFSILKANQEQLKKIDLPLKIKSVGRPKGTVNTVIGTKRKPKTQKAVPPIRIKVVLEFLSLSSSA
jgi:hypothetical protein